MNLEEKLRILEAMMHSQVSTVGDTIKYGAVERMVAFLKAIDRTECQCFICDYSPCKKYGKEWDLLSDVEQKELEPHRIVHGNFGGLYTEDNVVPLCKKCHSEEYKFFKTWWEKQPIPREPKERIKYFFEMFKVFVIENKVNNV